MLMQTFPKMSHNLLLLVVAVIFCLPDGDSAKLNDRPIIGIMSEDMLYRWLEYGNAFVASAYVKLVEAGGARVVPIKLGESDEYYEKMFQSINGLVFPGGGVDPVTSYYAKASKKMFDLAVKANKNGDYFPILGICLGFEMMGQFLLQKKILTPCKVENIALPLNFKIDPSNSTFFQDLPPSLSKVMKSEAVTINFHHACFLLDTFNKGHFEQVIKVLTTSNSSAGSEFISTYEAVNFPFYGLQWHPEKNVYLWLNKPELINIPHSANAIKTTQYVSNFFAQQARMNFHRFSSRQEESNNLIYNYDAIYTGKHIDVAYYEQIYIVPGNITIKKPIREDNENKAL